MSNSAITSEESSARSCSVKMSNCSGPTVSGLHGYTCESCLEEIYHLFSSGAIFNDICSYCGSNKAVDLGKSGKICQECVGKGLSICKNW
ncbi:hypothetical protein H4J55_00185 [Colwellia sp. MB3u-22]|jgi:hypothetical protein|nr:hypothetical protein [Colwellia sp. MB02u-7]MBA6234520.1 hypothetical protein [Colwellia sp. MB02u-11]MBA6297874.1 hypothetical protein [Colwellia sp. MB3u-22]MBA6309411.1 hypothetical protein [Colwellia sp. MB3u-64]